MSLPSISYIISTIRPWNMVQQTINSIQAMGEHDHEILICSPYEYNIKHDNVKFLLDDENNGSRYAWNKMVKYSQGDWIMEVTDDWHFVNLDIQKLLRFTYSDKMLKKTFKLIHMTARNVWGETTPFNIDVTPITTIYPCIHFSFIEKKTINKKLDGVIFNERFRNCYVDHWLGFYCSQNEKYKPLDYNLFDGNDGIRRPMDDPCGRGGEFIGWIEDHGDQTNRTYHQHDYQVLKYLYENFEKGVTPYNYVGTPHTSKVV